MRAAKFLSLRAAAFVLILSTLAPCQAAAQQPQTSRVVAYVEMALQHGDLASASALVGQYRKLYGDTPEALEALSWVARGDLASGNLDLAYKNADEIRQSSQTALATRKLDAEPHLPTALGAAYEIQAEVLFAQHKRAEALALLNSGLRTWRGTSIEDRLQKNLNLIQLQGRPVPPLTETQWIGPKPASLASLRGKVVLLFFWAHWCQDCKAEGPVIEKLASELGPKGLVVLAPTRLYGYTAEDEHADPAKETAFVEKVYDHYYSSIPNAGVPLDQRNFDRFGASTTPTLVLVSRQGIVKLYHPGLIDEQALRTQIETLLKTQPAHTTP